MLRAVDSRLNRVVAIKVPFSPKYYEDSRRAAMLLNATLDIVMKEHPEDWREKIQQAIPGEFENAGATVDDYLASVSKVGDCLA